MLAGESGGYAEERRPALEERAAKLADREEWWPMRGERVGKEKWSHALKTILKTNLSLECTASGAHHRPSIIICTFPSCLPAYTPAYLHLE